MASLLLMCGLPASGKTTMADELRTALEAAGHTVVTIRDDDDALTNSNAPTTAPPSENKTTDGPPSLARRSLMYADAAAEKQTRARLRTAADRALASPVTVLVDSLNYIKGFRYELHCIARAHNVRYALIHVDATGEECAARDAARAHRDSCNAAAADQYGEGIVRELVARFEPPNASRKWERPLYTLRAGASAADRAALAAEITAALRAGKALVTHKAVAAVAQAAPDGLAALDRVTRAAETALVTAVQAGASVGSSVEIPAARAPVRLGRRVRVSEIRAMRRAYINLSRVHVPNAVEDGKLADEFVAYINAQVQAPR